MIPAVRAAPGLPTLSSPNLWEDPPVETAGPPPREPLRRDFLFATSTCRPSSPTADFAPAEAMRPRLSTDTTVDTTRRTTSTGAISTGHRAGTTPVAAPHRERRAHDGAHYV